MVYFVCLSNSYSRRAFTIKHNVHNYTMKRTDSLNIGDVYENLASKICIDTQATLIHTNFNQFQNMRFSFYRWAVFKVCRLIYKRDTLKYSRLLTFAVEFEMLMSSTAFF